VNVTVLEGRHQLAIVGESHYQNAIWQEAAATRGTEVRKDSIAILVPEPENEFDRNAIAVLLPTGKAGYLSRDDAQNYLPGLRTLMATHKSPIALRCIIVGGGYADGYAKSLGVWLSHDPTDFGLKAEPPPVRTGQAHSGVPTWRDGLPEDSIKRIAYLRKVLTVETAPIDRHFTYLTLEETLYKCRTIFPSALEEYESVALAHDDEMSTIAPALIIEFQGMPTLPVYKQMTILKTKAKDYNEALRWARRGLELYSNRCITDGADDLRKRVEKLEAKLGHVPAVGVSPAVADTATPIAAAVPKPDWYPDPTGRFQHRYWDGDRWTNHVATNGVAAEDATA
jgi:hypothetical protein